MRLLSFLLLTSALCCALCRPAAAASLQVTIAEADTPLLTSTKPDAKVVRRATQGEVFTAFVSSLYGGYYMVVDKKSNSFLYIPFSAAQEIVKRPKRMLVSGEFKLPSKVDLSKWQVLPRNATFVEGDRMLKYRSQAESSSILPDGKQFPTSYSYNTDYRPRVDGQQLVRDAADFLGVPYVLGGTTGQGVDCSGLTKVCLLRQGIDVLHRASLQALEGCYVNVSELSPGDLLFFRDDHVDRFLSHVGIYVGNGKFIHASHSAGSVVVGRLSDRYFKSHYAFARRL